MIFSQSVCQEARRRQAEGRSPSLHTARPPPNLRSSSTLAEDRAVDLYVLERTLVSTHPKHAAMFEGILSAYSEGAQHDVASVMKRLEAVRARGRKRTAFG